MGRAIDFADNWRSLFDTWMDLTAPLGFNDSKLFVSVRPSLFEWPILHDPASFIATFGRILRFNSTFLNLAATVLYALNKEYGLDMDPGKVGVPEAGKFYGAHLRTDRDAVAASFASYEEQSTAYLASAERNGLSLIYVASGSIPDVERFTTTPAEMGIKVTTKIAVLEKEPEFAGALAELRALTWDQQALIDYLILLRSSHFGGTWASSFSYNIAFRRHVVVGKGEWVPSTLALEETMHGGRNRGDGLRDGECYKYNIRTSKDGNLV